MQSRPRFIRRSRLRTVVFVGITVLATCGRAAAQDMEPRAYAASPTGSNFLVVVAGRSTGGVLVDPSLPIEDVQASVNTLTVGVGRTFKFLDRTALLVAAVPMAWLDASGRVGDETGHVT